MKVCSSLQPPSKRKKVTLYETFKDGLAKWIYDSVKDCDLKMKAL